MTKYELIAEKVIVTFLEAAAAYLIVIPTVNWSKVGVAGAIGAGLSAAYNLLRESTPTMGSAEPLPVTGTAPQIVAPDPTPPTQIPVQ